MTAPAETVPTRYPIPPRVRPEELSWAQARCIQRALVNAGIPCRVTNHDGHGVPPAAAGGRPLFLGCTAAEVVAAASRIPSIRVNWLKVVKAEHLIGLKMMDSGVPGAPDACLGFTSPLLVWAPLATEGGGQDAGR